MLHVTLDRGTVVEDSNVMLYHSAMQHNNTSMPFSKNEITLVCHNRLTGTYSLYSSSKLWQLHGCTPLKLMQSFQILVIFWLVLWILSSSWLNVASGALLKVMLLIQRSSKEISVLTFQNQMLSVALCCGLNCSGVLIPHKTPHSLKSTAMSALVTLQ